MVVLAPQNRARKTVGGRKLASSPASDIPPKKRALRPKKDQQPGQPEEATQPYPLGWWIVKAFDDVVYTGRVVRAKLPEHDDEDRRVWYTVCYVADGDSEDLLPEEIDAGVRAFREVVDAVDPSRGDALHL